MAIDDDSERARQRGQAILDTYGERKWGDDLYRGTNEDGPMTHFATVCSQRLGVSVHEVAIAMGHAMRRRAPLREPFGDIKFVCLELLRTPTGCDALYRVVAEEIELEQRITRVLKGNRP